MNDRDCDNCTHHSEGGCSVWECSFTQKEDDTISRQAAIDAVCGWRRADCTPCEYFPCGEIKAIQALPPAQPNLQQTCNQLATDTISRQDAIDVIMDYPHGDVWNVENMDNMVCEIKALPPAQPTVQPQRTCINCGRTANNGGWYADGRTRCPIEEHYALPKDGFCHLWEKRNVTDDDYPERREE